MRPDLLYPIFAQTVSLPGIGGRFALLLEKLAGTKIIDLLWHLPTEVNERQLKQTLDERDVGEIVIINVDIDRHEPPGRKGRNLPYRVWCRVAGQPLCLVFFHARGDYLQRQLPEGQQRIISGKVESYQSAFQMTHPDYILSGNESAEIPRQEAIYPLTAGLSNKTVHKAISASLERLPVLPEWLDAAYLKQKLWPSWHDAIIAAHRPKDAADINPLSPSRSRLAYDELLANQLALALVRQRYQRRAGRKISGNGKLRQQLYDLLPYQLTDAQKGAIKDIEQDLSASHAMYRLLQGDVGSGKTIVALVALMSAVECEAQGALLAPTEILAQQHFRGITSLLKDLPVRVELLTGRVKGKKRQEILTALEQGKIDILIGTHAIIQEGVAFHDLAVSVIDEQHRFGVEQRMALMDKGRKGKGDINILSMTATPIPRTLTLTAYGDMDVSRLLDKPAGRKPIDTRIMSLHRLQDIIAAVRRAITEGRQLYWVCPLVEESEVIDLAAAENRYQQLKEIFPGKVGLVHGKMKGAEKDAVMMAFAAGEIKILVATTVIEVGVDVPNATIILIEHAERFGLAQLHQLRGRVGRGSEKSSCLLLYGNMLSEVAQKRLKIMRETEDGFQISEEDLKLRGAGEVLGTRQSGLPEFHVASLDVHGELLQTARDDAALIMTVDPKLETSRGQALRVLLYLFEKDQSIQYIKSG